MPLALYMTEDRELRLNVDPEAWAKAFKQALANDGVIEIRNPQGRTLSINPRQVLYWVVPEEDEATPEAAPRPPQDEAVPA